MLACHHVLVLVHHRAGAAHWEGLLRARAIECQCYVIAAAQAGTHNERRASYGHSLVVNPWGVVIAALDDPHETGVWVGGGGREGWVHILPTMRGAAVKCTPGSNNAKHSQ